MAKTIFDQSVTETTSIIETIRVIGDTNLQIALVCRDGKLVGTATDGDIRRAILASVPLDRPIAEVMNKTPITAPVGITNEAALALMRRHAIHQLPVIDAEGRVREVKLIDQLTQPSHADHWVVLMAGGLGSRLKPLTDELPKPLIKVGDKPILETVLTGFVKAGFENFFISVNYKAEMIRSHFGDGSAWGVRIQYLHEKEQLGTAGALSLLPSLPERPFFVMNGDLLTTVDFEKMLKYHGEHNAFLTVCVRDHTVTVPFGVVELSGNRLLSIEEKPTKRYFVNAGVYLLESGVLDYVRAGERLDMPTLIERLVAAGKTVAVFPLREYWIDVGRLDDLQRASEEFQRVFG